MGQDPDDRHDEVDRVARVVGAESLMTHSKPRVGGGSKAYDEGWDRAFGPKEITDETIRFLHKNYRRPRPEDRECYTSLSVMDDIFAARGGSL